MMAMRPTDRPTDRPETDALRIIATVLAETLAELDAYGTPLAHTGAESSSLLARLKAFVTRHVTRIQP